MKKLLSMLLAAAMLVSASAMAFAEGTSEKGTIVYGSSTEIGGDFAPDSWWTNNATDKMIRNLTNDYTVTTTNQGGEYVVNPTIELFSFLAPHPHKKAPFRVLSIYLQIH